MFDAADAFQYILRSLYVTAISTTAASVIGIPLGFCIGLRQSRGARAAAVIFRSLTALPTVVVGLLVYFLISRTGPLGALGMLYSKSAIVFGQTILILPIIISYTSSAVSDFPLQFRETLKSLEAGRIRSAVMIFFEKKTALLTSVVTAWARAVGEIGVSMMLGGNIRSARTVTTAIAFESGRGAFETALLLGAFLISVSLGVNILLHFLAGREQKRVY